jgi:preprotein translocase subunit SecA
MEALRVSIGLEAYAQRDPLVQYKSRAFALFQELLGNMRLGVITRMFTYRPRDLSSVQAAASHEEAPKEEESVENAAEEPVEAEEAGEVKAPASVASSGGKRRRRRHR